MEEKRPYALEMEEEAHEKREAKKENEGRQTLILLAFLYLSISN